MQVEITVKVNGEVAREHVEQVSGTLEDMEEKIDALSREVACSALLSLCSGNEGSLLISG